MRFETTATIVAVTTLLRCGVDTRGLSTTPDGSPSPNHGSDTEPSSDSSQGAGGGRVVPLPDAGPAPASDAIADATAIDDEKPGDATTSARADADAAPADGGPPDVSRADAGRADAGPVDAGRAEGATTVPSCEAGVLATCGGQCVSLQVDPGNCGACGHDCQGAGCLGGKCQPLVLASGLTGPTGIAVDATNVYWTNDANPGSVMSCALRGCNQAPTTLASGLASPMGIVVDANNVYWVNSGTVAGNDGSVMKCALGGCNNSPSLVAPMQAFPQWIALDATSLYWTNYSGGVGGGVMTCALGACAQPATIAPGHLSSGIGVDQLNVYWSDFNSAIFKCSVAGCNSQPTVVANGDATYATTRLVVGDGKLYWTNVGTTGDASPGGGTVVTSSADGGAPTFLAHNQPNASGIAVDATNVYWVSVDGEVMECAKSGCNDQPTILASGLLYPASIVADASSLYWVNAGNPGTPTGSVMKLAK